MNNKSILQTRYLKLNLIILGLFQSQTILAEALPATVLPEVSVQGTSIKHLFNQTNASNRIVPNLTQSQAEDVTALITKVPNVNVVRHGNQTGLVQIRGLSQDRVKVKIDGMEITPACPNHMDPPLHYANMEEVKNIQVISGITPVSQGGDSLGGTISVKTKQPQFASATESSIFSGNISVGHSGSNGSNRFAVGGSIAHQNVALNLNYESHKADNTQTPRGELKNSSYDIEKANINLGVKLNANHQLGLEMGQQLGSNIGTPALGMDMTKDNAYKTALTYLGNFGNIQVDGRLYHHKIDHIMDNYTMRSTMMKMVAPATSINSGFILNGQMNADDKNTYRIGFEQHNNDFDVYMINPMGKRQDSFKDDSRDRTGIYGEWEHQYSSQTKILAGIRADQVKMSAGQIVNLTDPTNMMMVNMQKAFNASDLNKTDHNFDWTLLLNHKYNDNLTYEAGLARKTRSPSIIERYIWTPSGTYGQNDGRSYLGDVNLKPEVSHQLNVGATWKQSNLALKANVFYNKISDYIQGVATANLDSNGLAILKYSNISSATLYGFELGLNYDINQQLKLDSQFGYTVGKNKATDDNLYRIAPAKLQMGLNYQPSEQLGHRVELIASARQNKVSAYNGEKPTAGYGVLNYSTTMNLTKKAQVVFGVDNLADKSYAEHLNGLNKISGSAVAVGERLLNPARFAYFGFKANF